MKKNNLLSILLLVSVGFFFSACDQTDPPYLDDNETEFVIDTNNKKVLIEDFTGYTCGNCPNAGVIAHDLEHLYKERVIGIEVHVGSFAVPKAPHKEEYRSETSTEIDEEFSVSKVGTPNGLINRIHYQNKLILAKDAWGGAVIEQLNQKAEVKIYMEAEYDENNRKIDLEVNLNFLEDQTQRDNRLAVYILEDSVVGYQKWYRHEPEDIEDYVHHNVLRGSMNGTWGQTITEPSVNISYSVSAEEKWRMNKIKLLAIVYDNNDKSILNVEWIELEAEAVVVEEKEIEFEGMSKDTVVFSGFGSTELAWDCELKNISEKEIELQVGYKVLKHQVGHNVSMCVLACFPVENNEFISPNLITLDANEATQKYDIVMHVEVKPNDILTKGETQVEFFAYPKGKIDQKITKIITYIAK